MRWQDALMRLHVAGWDTDDIDAACDALIDAWEESDAPDFSVEDFSVDEVAEILDVELVAAEVPALLSVAIVRAGYGAESEALADALYDIDAFAYEYGGDD